MGLLMLWFTCSHFNLRWYSPEKEIALCGHATLAAACAIFRGQHSSRAILQDVCWLKYILCKNRPLLCSRATARNKEPYHPIGGCTGSNLLLFTRFLVRCRIAQCIINVLQIRNMVCHSTIHIPFSSLFSSSGWFYKSSSIVYTSKAWYAGQRLFNSLYRHWCYRALNFTFWRISNWWAWIWSLKHHVHMETLLTLLLSHLTLCYISICPKIFWNCNCSLHIQSYWKAIRMWRHDLNQWGLVPNLILSKVGTKWSLSLVSWRSCAFQEWTIPFSAACSLADVNFSLQGLQVQEEYGVTATTKWF